MELNWGGGEKKSKSSYLNKHLCAYVSPASSSCAQQFHTLDSQAAPIVLGDFCLVCGRWLHLKIIIKENSALTELMPSSYKEF